jgi:Pyridoxamine 5'-phosphate oxidase
LNTSIIPENYLDLLQSRALAYLATIGPKGEPQVSAVWFTWDGTHRHCRGARARHSLSILISS